MRKIEEKDIDFEKYPDLTVHQVKYLLMPPHTYYFKSISKNVKKSIETLCEDLECTYDVVPSYDPTGHSFGRKQDKIRNGCVVRLMDKKVV